MIGLRKCDWLDKAKVRRMRRSGMVPKILSEFFRCSIHTIQTICKGMKVKKIKRNHISEWRW